MRTLSLLLLALLPACREKDNLQDSDSPVDTNVPAVDADGDGIVETEDCNDDNSAIHPGAMETCDGIDNNCDGLVDDNDPALYGASTWYADSDLDGYGGTQFEVSACEAPDGYVDNNADCNDWDLNAHPGADEVCDGADNDCDGTWDEPDATDASTWYADNDGDGFGTSATTTTACEAPAGYSLHEGDCDDTNPAYNPSALEADCTDANDYNCDGSVGYADADADGYPACEDCDDASATVNDDADEICDGIDNNCNGLIDADDSAITDATTWYGDADGDGYGGSQFALQDCSAPAGYVASADDCNDLDPASHPGAVEVCDTADNDCDTEVDEGVLLTWYADTDGDGYGDAASTQDACTMPPGYSANGDDCNDSNAQVSPAAYEVCDSTDNDCDSSVDEDALDQSDWYADSDNDGYGDSSSSQTACSAPSNHVGNGDDCNDGDAAINPGVSETCDSVDNNCDGVTDESDAVDAQTWYPDTDSDGYGDASNPSVACTQPSSHVVLAGDCDDTNAAVSPVATEGCDSIDNNCDGIIDEDSAFDATTWYQDSDSDGYGSDTTSSSCSKPSGYVATGGDCDDASASVNPGATESCNGVDDNCDGTAATGPGSGQICAGDSCNDLLAGDSSLPSDTYWIDPDEDGDTSNAFEVYCDMTTDGGGYTLVGAWGSQSGYNMHSNTAGLLVDEVKDAWSSPRSSGSGLGNGPTHYSSSVISDLFHNGENTYLSLVGRSPSGWILTRQTKDSADAGFNAFQGIYYTAYTAANGFTSVYRQSGSNTHPLPIASPNWTNASTTGRGCSAPTGGIDCYHYLPDDITGGGQWLFRENLDNTPFDSYGGTSNVPSLLFIR